MNYRFLLCRQSVALALLCLNAACKKDATEAPQQPDDAIYRIPVVVHIIHHGEPVGEGYNLSNARIQGQIRILNEDFRRKKGTPGFNDHPDGADTGIEFVLAKSTPGGKTSSGIVRINADSVNNPVAPNFRFDHFAYYSYWDYERYLNIWVEPLPESTIDIVLGQATGPDTDLPDNNLQPRGEPLQAEGILINAFHFGESGSASKYNQGRTLTHEAGHYLGLLHLWGSGDCDTNDYCADTPPVATHHSGCVPMQACDGGQAMAANYMDYTPDHCMNLFTKDQTARMHHVLQNSPARKTLPDSPGLRLP